MAKKNNSARRHSSPGLYFTDTVVNYATKSLGITSLGVVGETLRGRAFEPTEINDWGEFIYNFGGTSTEKYRGSQYPKYELPYIAQSYLEESHNLKVVRVLGLSGVNAGPAWVVTAKGKPSNAINPNEALTSEEASEVNSALSNKYSADDRVSIDDSVTYNDTLTGAISRGTKLSGEQATAVNEALGTDYTADDEISDADSDKYNQTLEDSVKPNNTLGTQASAVNAALGTKYHADDEISKSDSVYYNGTITENDSEYNNMTVLVLRSRGEHKKAAFVQAANPSQGICDDVYEYDAIQYYAADVELVPSSSLNLGQECTPGYVASSDGYSGYFTSDVLNYGTFTIKVTLNNENKDTNPDYVYYSVTLNPSDKNYIYNVIGGDPEKGDAEVYVEELYDVALKQLVNEDKIIGINKNVVMFENDYIVPSHEDVYDILTDNLPTKDMVGKRYLYSTSLSKNGTNAIQVRYNLGSGWGDLVDGSNGYIYTVYADYDAATGKRSYFYGAYAESTITNAEHLDDYNKTDDIQNHKFNNCVRVVAEDSFYISYNDNGNKDVEAITLDFNNYKEQYRWATSPWVVSEMKGSAEKVELNKLFRFHSISDGSNSTTEFKVSIENIDPETGKFDVVIRDFYDSDLSVNAYEKYFNCDLVPGSPNYIALKIGSTDGMYNSKSRYVTVEVVESDEVKNSVPAGFLGYPIRNYSGFPLAATINGNDVTDTDKPIAPYFRFNTNIDEDIKAKKQYFGVSDLVGIDEDVFKYKGVEAYVDGNPDGLTPCFHLDSRILNGKPIEDENNDHYGAIVYDDGSSEPIYQVVSVDGVTGYSWVTVNKNNTVPNAARKKEPRIGDFADMVDTIYETKAYRKFTMCMYGGWDGWDYYRTIRSNADEYQYKAYKGAIDSKSGYGSTFSIYQNPESIGFDNETIITSDYYAYLGGAKLLGNPKSVTVNVLATPGIDYVNNKALVGDVIDMVEEDRADLVYVITTPDKPSGAGDTVDEMYSVQDAVYNLEDSDIDSNYCCTYYPWVKYYDADNYQYVYLPLTRDVVRSIAYTDNVKFSWYANAGWNRGNIPGNASPRKKLTLSEQDTLYDGRINFVNSFAEEGNKIWGDKNLQIDDNLLNRISKRRLLLRIRTMLQNACIGLIFDPNDLTMSQTVRSAVSKVLDDVKTGRGITDYKIEIDDSAETRDQLGLNVTYHIKPIQALEWINFTSVLTPEGMQWT